MIDEEVSVKMEEKSKMLKVDKKKEVIYEEKDRYIESSAEKMKKIE
jgi:hypothetical protein